MHPFYDHDWHVAPQGYNSFPHFSAWRLSPLPKHAKRAKGTLLAATLCSVRMICATRRDVGTVPRARTLTQLLMTGEGKKEAHSKQHTAVALLAAKRCTCFYSRSQTTPASCGCPLCGWRQHAPPAPCPASTALQQSTAAPGVTLSSSIPAGQQHAHAPLPWAWSSQHMDEAIGRPQPPPQLNA